MHGENPGTLPARVLLVSHFQPSPVGHGGNHRAYQIRHDVANLAGETSIRMLCWRDWFLANETQIKNSRSGTRSYTFAPNFSGRELRIGSKITTALRRTRFIVTGNPGDLVRKRSIMEGAFSSDGFLSFYRQQIAELGKPAVCIVEHPGFAGIVSINQQLGIPTIICAQNVESLDGVAPLRSDQERETYQAALAFAYEFRVLARCDYRFFISKVETGLVGGLGAPSHYYPYLPVGEIRNALEKTRAQRASSPAEKGLFLLLGTTGHTTTRHAFEWFLANIRQRGLPSGARVVVCGQGTESLLPAGAALPHVELRGWVSQEELESLLQRVDAVLIPHTTGFGALTRLPEMALAGIPTIVSDHAGQAIDLPPGVVVVSNDWEDWRRAMQQVIAEGVIVRPDAYATWESAQSDVFKQVIKKLLATSNKPL